METVDIDQLIKLGQAASPIQTPANGIPFVVIPSDCKIESLDKQIYTSHNDRPERKKGHVKVLDAPSFCEYFKLFEDEDSRCFSDETQSSFLAILDYHKVGEKAARWGEHRVSLALRKAEEWVIWSGKNGKQMSQMEFAEFIEENQPDITNPSGATMLEVARDLSAKSGVDFSSAVSQSNGAVKLHYTEQVKGTYGTGDVEVPERFEVTVPIYIGSEPVTLTARLRYRLNSGKLTFWYNLLRAAAAERAGFATLHAGIESSLGRKIINGQP